MTQYDKNMIIENSVNVLDAFFSKVELSHIWPTIVTVVSESLVDGKLNSLNWFSSTTLKKYNSLDGISILERKVEEKLFKEIRFQDEIAWTEWKVIYKDIAQSLNQKGKLKIY